LYLPLHHIKAGFPNPADEYLESSLDLNSYLIPHPASTYILRVSGDSMVDVGIYEGDLLIVDRAIDPRNGKIIVAYLDDSFTVKIFEKKDQSIYLVPANKKYSRIDVTNNPTFEIFGVVTHCIHIFK